MKKYTLSKGDDSTVNFIDEEGNVATTVTGMGYRELEGSENIDYYASIVEGKLKAAVAIYPGGVIRSWTAYSDNSLRDLGTYVSKQGVSSYAKDSPLGKTFFVTREKDGEKETTEVISSSRALAVASVIEKEAFENKDAEIAFFLVAANDRISGRNVIDSFSDDISFDSGIKFSSKSAAEMVNIDDVYPLNYLVDELRNEAKRYGSDRWSIESACDIMDTGDFGLAKENIRANDTFVRDIILDYIDPRLWPKLGSNALRFDESMGAFMEKVYRHNAANFMEDENESGESKPAGMSND